MEKTSEYIIGFLGVVNNNPEIFFWTIVASFLIVAVLGLVLVNKEAPIENKIETKITAVSVNEAQEVLVYLNALIQEKFNYHLYSKLLTTYSDNRVPEVKDIKKIKEHIYLSVTTSLAVGFKKTILRYHTVKGIEVIIHERVMTLLNEVDFTMTNKKDGFKELNLKNLSKII